jgi:hypothetical protein
MQCTYIDSTEYKGNILNKLTPYKVLDHMIDPHQKIELKGI